MTEVRIGSRVSQPYAIRVLTGTDTDALRAVLTVFGEAVGDPEEVLHFDISPTETD
jgi:hypothetical protein